MSEQDGKSQDITQKKPIAKVKILLGLLIIAAAITGIELYYHYTLNFPDTDDAYVNANLINIAPKVEGFVDSIQVKNDQYVKKGDLLLAINPVDYNLNVEQESSAVNASFAQVGAANENILVAKTNITKSMSDYAFNSKMAKRYTDLYNQHAGSLQDMQKYVNLQNQSLQQLNQAKLQLAQAKQQYSVVTSQLNANQVALNRALTNSGYTKIYSRVDGYVTSLNLANGQLVMAGQNLFGIVDSSNWWVDANYKETQIKRIKVGQDATVKLDMYDHVYKGKVISISRASGNTFSILPAQNATGNWIKVTQRFTVRILVNDDVNFPLRVGASANVEINTEHEKAKD